MKCCEGCCVFFSFQFYKELRLYEDDTNVLSNCQLDNDLKFEINNYQKNHK